MEPHVRNTLELRLQKIQNELNSDPQLNSLRELEQFTSTETLVTLERLGLAVSANQAKMTNHFPYVFLTITLAPGRILHELMMEGNSVDLMVASDSEPLTGFICRYTVSQLVVGFNTRKEYVETKLADKTVHLRWTREDDDIELLREMQLNSPLLKDVLDFLAAPATVRDKIIPVKNFQNPRYPDIQLNSSQETALKNIFNSCVSFRLVDAPTGVGRQRFTSALITSLINDQKARVLYVSPTQQHLDNMIVRFLDTPLSDKMVRIARAFSDQVPEDTISKFLKIIYECKLQQRTQGNQPPDASRIKAAFCEIISQHTLHMIQTLPSEAIEMQQVLSEGLIPQFDYVIIDEIYPTSMAKTLPYLPLFRSVIIIGGKMQVDLPNGQKGTGNSPNCRVSLEKDSLFHRLMRAYRTLDESLQMDLVGNMFASLKHCELAPELAEVCSKAFKLTDLVSDTDMVENRLPIPDDPRFLFKLSEPVIWIDVPPEKHPSRMRSDVSNILEADLVLHLVKHLRSISRELNPLVVSGTQEQHSLRSEEHTS